MFSKRMRNWREDRPAVVEATPEPPPPVVPPVSAAAPVNLGEVLRGVGAAQVLEDEAEAAPTAEPQALSGQPQEVQPPQDSEDESIDDYMSQLHGTAPQSERPVAGVRLSVRRGVSPAVSPESPRAVAEEPEDAEGPSRRNCQSPCRHPASRAKRRKRRPATTATETHLSMAAMREVANLSAQNAIHHHARRQMLRMTRTKLLIVLQAALAAVLLLWMWGHPGANIFTFYGFAASVLVLVVWGSQYAGHDR